MTPAAKAFLNDVRLRTWPFPGATDRAIDTGVWFDEFIRPASVDPSIRIISGSWQLHHDKEIPSNLGTIVLGNPYAVDENGNSGKGTLCNVRMGSIPHRQVWTDLWAPEDYAKNEEQMRRKHRGRQRDLLWDDWPSITVDLIQRGIVLRTPEIRMLLGS